MARYTLNTEALLTAAAADPFGDKSFYAIAKRSGVGKDVLSRVSRGIDGPALDTAYRLAKTYGLTVEDLVNEVDDEEPESCGEGAAA